MKKYLYLIALYMVCLGLMPQAQAKGFELLGGGWSYHYDREGDFNESHSVIGACMSDICGASFTNSHGVRSVLGYYNHQFYSFLDETVVVSGKLGVMGGYSGHVEPRYEAGGFIPMVGLGVGVKVLTIDSTSLWVDTTITPVVAMFNLRVSL